MPAVLAQDPFAYKAHPQPPIDERLKQSRNFLADEDVNRCLGFKAKLDEIEEFLNHIEKENLPRNRYLFSDVKAMIDVQKDWMSRMDMPPVDYDGPGASSISKHSTRLISLATAADFQRQREAYGIVTQMRDDHAPFTVERSSDQVEFLVKMRQDARTHPSVVDQSTNLLYVEHSAYDWALREPSLIPHWLHWKRGLPSKGIRQENSRLRSLAKVPRAPALKPHNIFLREVLPDYLQLREDEINRLLRFHDSYTVSSNLAELLNFHAPRAFKDLRDKHDYLACIQDLLSVDERQELSSIKSTLEKDLNGWIATLRPRGIQIRLSHDTWTDPNSPGVFYVTDGQPTPRDYDQLQERENKINSLLEMSQLSSEEEGQLKSLLDGFVPEEIRRCDDRAQAILLRASKKSHTEFNRMSQAKQEEFNKSQLNELKTGMRQSYTSARVKCSSMFDSWLANLRASAPISLKFLRQGEIGTASPRELYIQWSPEIEPRLQIPPPEVQLLETEINDCLFAVVSTRVKESQKSRLDELLEPIMPGQQLQDEAVDNNSQPLNVNRVAGKITGSSREAYRLWRDCLLWRKLEIRMPHNGTDSDFDPGVLYYRVDDSIRQPPPPARDLDQWAEQVNATRRSHDHKDICPTIENSFNKIEDDMYQLIEELQYPALKQMDVTWRTLDFVPSSDKKIVQEFKTAWMREFRKWLAMLLHHSTPIKIKKADPDNDTLGDPGVVYYRGQTFEADSDAHRESENFNPIPEGVQKKIDQINGLIKEFHKAQTKNKLEDLENLLRDFWRPARDHEDCQDLLKGQSLDLKEVEQLQLRGQEFEKRLYLFIQESAKSSFKVKVHRSGTYMADDPTIKLSEHWRIPGDHWSWAQNPQHFRKLLNRLWVYPKRFYRTLRDMEIEINDHLQQLSPNRPSTNEDNSRLLQLMLPFLPHALADLARRLENAFPSRNPFYDSVDPQHAPVQRSFIALYGQWIRTLQRFGKTKWIKLFTWDQSELFSGSFMGLEGRLYYPKPEKHNALPVLISQKQDPLPLRFQRYEMEINGLLKKRKLQPPSLDKTSLTWKENDRLRQLLHLAMNPVIAEVDIELREMDDKSREDILQGEELISYLSKYEIWLARYNRWIDSFPDDGIELRPWKRDSPRTDNTPGVRYVDVENERQLPLPFRGRKVPLHVQRMTREFNIALRVRNPTNLEKKAIYDKYLPLIRATYREELDKFRQYFFHEHFPDKVHPNNPAPSRPEMISILECVENLAIQAIWERLRQTATSSRQTGISIEIYEQLRGELRIREKSADTSFILEDEDESIEARRSITPVSGIVIPGCTEAMEEYLPLAEKVRNGQIISESEQGEIIRHIRPRSERIQAADSQQAIDLVLKVHDGGKLTDSEEALAKEYILRGLWQHFTRVSSELVERACPELKCPKPANGLMDQNIPPATAQRISPLDPAPTEAEIREVGTEINNLLQKFRDGTITIEEDQVLDYLLRPMVNDRLRELDRQIRGLSLMPKFADHSMIPPYQECDLNPRQSLHLVELQTQWEREFEKWKVNLPAYGVIVDEWFSEPDVIPNVFKRYGEVRETINRPQEHYPEYKDPHEILLILKRYITDSSFTDDGGKLMLDRVPVPIAALRNELFQRRQTLNARNQRPSLSESLSLNLLEHDFVSEYMAWYNAVPVRYMLSN